MTSTDKSAAQRAELAKRIVGVERQEDEFSELRNSYRRSLELFHEQFHSVSRRRESCRHEQAQSGSRAAQQALAAAQDLLFQLDRYVDASLEEIDQTSSQVRQSLDDEREKLIAEKDGLPWE